MFRGANQRPRPSPWMNFCRGHPVVGHHLLELVVVAVLIEECSLPRNAGFPVQL
jgi:hypothetical protein